MPRVEIEFFLKRSSKRHAFEHIGERASATAEAPRELAGCGDVYESCDAEAVMNRRGAL